MTDHSIDIGIDNQGEDNNIAIIAEALESSLNKTLARHSLWIELEESDLDNEENTKMIYFDFAFGNLSNFK
jgi:hypothetical protein